MKYSKIKIFGVFCIAILVAMGISNSSSTVAYYKDIEVSNLNRFVSPPLSFDVLIDGQDNVTVDLTSGEVELTPIMTPHVGSSPIQYWVSAQVVGGDASLCDAIDLFGTFPFPYNNRLNLLQTSTTTQTGAWTNTFSIFDGPDNHANTSCTVDLIYRGFMEGLPFGQGYTDIQVVTITFNVGENIQIVELNSLIVEKINELEENTQEENIVEEEEKEEKIVEVVEEISPVEEIENNLEQTPKVTEETSTNEIEI